MTRYMSTGKQNLMLWYQTDTTVPKIGPISGKFHQNFYKNFGRTSPKTWTNPIYTCIEKHNSKDPMATINATRVSTQF